MWPFSKPTIEDLESKAYLVYHEFGPKLRIPREERLLKKFPQVERTIIKIWLDQFKSIDREIGSFTGTSIDFDSKELKTHLKERFPFMNKKALEEAVALGRDWNR
jgi:hypothetical protein